MQPSQALVVGAILASSWGYEQTNVDFYRAEKIKNGWVTLQKIDAVETSDDREDYISMTGRVVPVEPHKPIGDPFRRKLGECCGQISIKICSYEYASLWDGHPKAVSHYA
jgi:hypothetical protein